VGEEVPFVTGSFSSINSNSSNGNPFTTVNREEVGVMLKVKPQISKGNGVRLEIEQESSKVKNGSGDVGMQTTSKSTMQTNVMIQDGELLILGGLIEDQSNNSASKVPLLGDIPLLGRLFRSSGRSDTQRVLMMFIRPTIIRTAEDARKLSTKKFDHLITRDIGGGDKGVIARQLEEFRQQEQTSD